MQTHVFNPPYMHLLCSLCEKGGGYRTASHDALGQVFETGHKYTTREFRIIHEKDAIYFKQIRV
jgi:hypothetical protein